MRLIAFLFMLFAISFTAKAQITTDPEVPKTNSKVTITFNSAEESRLGYFTGDLYAHTGVTIEGTGRWQNVIADWGDNDNQPKLTHKGDGIYELEIAPTILSFYNVQAGDQVTELCMVFRSADNSSQTNDLFIEVFSEGLFVNITEPQNNSTVAVNEALSIKAAATEEAALKLFIGETEIKDTTATSISSEYTFTETGMFWVIAEATTDSTVRDSVEIFVRGEVVEEELPAGYKKGINYTSDNSVGLVLYAPKKENVFVIGDFNDWKYDNAYAMKKDGDIFWLDIDGLNAGEEYAFQYLIDGTIRIADPYTEKILDPWNDPYIETEVYPNLKAYPTGKTEGIVAILQTAQNEYNWEVKNFQVPAKEEMVIYELLIRDFMTEHSYQSVIDQLDYLEDLRVNVLELMPVNEFEGNSSWGYNPSFYFAPDKYYGPKDKLKELIDECHKRGIAVVIDMVLNHSYGQSPFLQMYANNYVPTEDNPWYNVESNIQNPSLQWGADFNHESQQTKELVDSVNSFWMNEYKIDGFRFDFTKGFSNTPYPPSSWASEYDAARIANLKRMADEIWNRNPDALVILEHLTDNSEETELANYGMMLWGNMHGSYQNAARGETSNSNLTWALYSERGWNHPNLVAYPESHDEERIMYSVKNTGLASGDYNTRNQKTALKRIELNSLFYFLLPGPKMIWQFGERGYDLSINRCENGSISSDCRTSPKPPYWQYLNNTDRTDLFQVMAKLNELNQTYEEFTPDNFTHDLDGATKTFISSNGDNHAIAIGNFGLETTEVTFTFPKTGKYYEFFTRDSVEFSSTSQTFSFEPGEYRLYSNRRFHDPHIITDIDEIERAEADVTIYPNPADTKITISSGKEISAIQVYSITGTLHHESIDLRDTRVEIGVLDYVPGVYLIRVVQEGITSTKKILVR